MAEKISDPPKNIQHFGTKQKQEHRGFQLGQNPMAMSAFETFLANQEKLDREKAHKKYVMGLQGRDGGKCIEP